MEWRDSPEMYEELIAHVTKMYETAKSCSRVQAIGETLKELMRKNGNYNGFVQLEKEINKAIQQ